jgi:transposase
MGATIWLPDRQSGMPRTVPLSITAAERKALKELAAQASLKQGHARRVRVVLLSAEGVSGVEIAKRLDLTKSQVSRIRRRFEEGRVEGLADRPKAGRGNNVPAEIVRKIIATVMSAPPKGYSHWSTGLLKKRFGLSRAVIHKILRANDLKPHLTRTFKVSKDPKFEAKALDVVGLYLHPPEKAVVLSVDEKTQVQALERTQPLLPLGRGKVARHTHDYKRNGVVDLYAALEIATGKVVHRVTESHTGEDFLGFMKQVAKEYPRVELHVIVDNSSTHSTPAVMDWLRDNPRVSFHFTPTSASWLNQVEAFFSILTRQSLCLTSFPTKGALKRHLRDYLAKWNSNPTPFVWTKKAHTIMRDHRKMLARISRTEH